MPFFRTLYKYVHHGRGVWSHQFFKPTRYELLQVRFPRAVFWGPSALWLLGELDQEPDALWIAIDNKARPPRTLDPTTVIIRTRRLNDDVLPILPARRPITLRVHNAERARADTLRRTQSHTSSREQPPRERRGLPEAGNGPADSPLP